MGRSAAPPVPCPRRILGRPGSEPSPDRLHCCPLDCALPPRSSVGSCWGWLARSTCSGCARPVGLAGGEKYPVSAPIAIASPPLGEARAGAGAAAARVFSCGWLGRICGDCSCERPAGGPSCRRARGRAEHSRKNWPNDMPPLGVSKFFGSSLLRDLPLLRKRCTLLRSAPQPRSALIAAAHRPVGRVRGSAS